jgi:hypothetical protein
MRTEIKIIDEESKLVNWRRFDLLMVSWLKRILIVNAVVLSAGLLLKELLWLAGM